MRLLNEKKSEKDLSKRSDKEIWDDSARRFPGSLSEDFLEIFQE